MVAVVAYVVQEAMTGEPVTSVSEQFFTPIIYYPWVQHLLTDAFGIAVKSQVSASGTYLLESTRIGISPNLHTLFIDRSYANASGVGWPQTGASDKRVADQPIMSYPVQISRGEAVEMVVIVDGGIVEVCANNRSVVAALALSGSANSTRVGVFGLPSKTNVHAEAWELTPLYPGAQ